MYRPLSQLAADVHRGARYVPLAEHHAADLASWAPTAGPDPATVAAGAAAGRGAPPPGALPHAALHAALQRLFTQPGGRGPGAGAVMFLYVNHIGWCRG